MSGYIMAFPMSRDVAQLPEIKMADCKPEVEYITGTERDITEIPKPILYLRQNRIDDGSSDIRIYYGLPVWNFFKQMVSFHS